MSDLRVAYLIMAVGFASFAEEYLFRGLLYRALDRDWSGWRAVLGAAAFFTVYHPLLAWPPVFCVGAVSFPEGCTRRPRQKILIDSHIAG